MPLCLGELCTQEKHSQCKGPEVRARLLRSRSNKDSEGRYWDLRSEE